MDVRLQPFRDKRDPSRRQIVWGDIEAAKRLPRVVVFQIKGGKLSVRARPAAVEFTNKFSLLLKRCVSGLFWHMECAVGVGMIVMLVCGTAVWSSGFDLCFQNHCWGPLISCRELRLWWHDLEGRGLAHKFARLCGSLWDSALLEEQTCSNLKICSVKVYNWITNSAAHHQPGKRPFHPCTRSAEGSINCLGAPIEPLVQVCAPAARHGVCGERHGRAAHPARHGGRHLGALRQHPVPECLR